MWRFDAGHFFGPGASRHIVGPKQYERMRRTGGGGFLFPSQDGAGETENLSRILEKVIRNVMLVGGREKCALKKFVRPFNNPPIVLIAMETPSTVWAGIVK